MKNKRPIWKLKLFFVSYHNVFLAWLQEPDNDNTETRELTFVVFSFKIITKHEKNQANTC